MPISNMLNVLQPSVYPVNPDFRAGIANNTLRIDSQSVFCRAAIVTLGMTVFAPLELALVAAVPLFLAAGYLDERRASKALDQRAVKFIVDADSKVPVATQVADYLKKHPSAIKSLVNDPKCTPQLKDVTFEDNSSLMKVVRSLKDNFSFHEGYQTKLELFKKLAHKDESTAKEFERLMLKTSNLKNSNFTELLIHILENDLVSPDQFTEHQISILWSNVKDYRVAQLMAQKGFNIEAVGTDDFTPLQRALLPSNIKENTYKEPIRFYNIETVILLLAHHAVIPNLSDTVEFTREGKNHTASYAVLLCHSKELIEYARNTQRHYDTEISNLPQVNPSFWQFLKPAIKTGGPDNTFDIDDGTRFTRSVVLGVIGSVSTFSLIAGSIAVSTSVAVAALPLIAGIGFTYLAYQIESKRAHIALDKMAYVAFKSRFTLPSVCTYILKNPSVLQRLFLENRDLTKPDASGHTLWYRAMDKYALSKVSLDPIRILAKAFFPNSYEMLTDTQYRNFTAAFNSGRIDILEYLLSTLNLNQFTAEQRTKIWMHANKNPQMVSLLVEAGFEINERDEKGYTPLLRVVQPENQLIHPYNIELIKAMLAAGADPKATVEVRMNTGERATKMVLDFVPGSDVAIRKLLENHKN